MVFKKFSYFVHIDVVSGHKYSSLPIFICPSGDRPYYVIGHGGRRAVVHTCFHTITLVLYIGHMIPLWNGENPIYFRVIRSKVKVTVTINIIFDNRVISAR